MKSRRFSSAILTNSPISGLPLNYALVAYLPAFPKEKLFDLIFDMQKFFLGGTGQTDVVRVLTTPHFQFHPSNSFSRYRSFLVLNQECPRT